MKVAYVLLLLVALAAPGFAQAPDDKLIVPGQRIGKWTLEMTIDTLLQMNGPRNGVALPALSRVVGGVGSMPADSDLWGHRWMNIGLAAVTNGRESQTVLELVWMAEEYKTDKGIGIGSSKEAVQSAYGPPTAVVVAGGGRWTGLYDPIGLAVGVDRYNAAVYVSVFLPGTAKQCYKF